MAQGLPKVPPLLLHHELQNVATFAARAKASPGAGIWEDHKRGGARVGMKGAETDEVLTRLPELNRFADDFSDVQAVFDFFDYRHLKSVSRLKAS